MRRVSKKRQKQDREEKQIRKLLKERCLIDDWPCCEVCGRPEDGYGLHPHEIQFRGRLGKLSLENSIMACLICHDHKKYPKTGLCISSEEALEIIEEQNERMEAENG